MNGDNVRVKLSRSHQLGHRQPGCEFISYRLLNSVFPSCCGFFTQHVILDSLQNQAEYKLKTTLKRKLNCKEKYTQRFVAGDLIASSGRNANKYNYNQ